MHDRALLANKATTFVVVWTVVTSLVLGVLAVLVQPVAAADCEKAGSVNISGDWTITSAQVCEGIVFKVDGNIVVGAGGSLTLINGGLVFTEDTTHVYSLTVQSGGDLILDNSIISTETRQINAYLQLAMTVTGAGSTLTMQNGAMLKFPGTLTVSSSATMTLRSSSITGFASSEISVYVPVSDVDANDDAPVMVFNGATVQVFDSRIERVYENAGVLGSDTRLDIQLQGATTLVAVNSYIGVDFNPDTPNGNHHNSIAADGTSRAYLYNVTIDEEESNLVPVSSWVAAYDPAGSGAFYLFRWLSVTATDASGVPAADAVITSRYSPNGTYVTYPDNGGSTVPSSLILGYLGRTAVNFNRTGADGKALIPIWTDLITVATEPNSEAFGSLNVTADYTGQPQGRQGVTFPSYPAITASNNTKPVTFQFTGLTLPKPDLQPTDATFTPSYLLEGGDVTIKVDVTNSGLGAANSILVRISDNFEGTTQVLGTVTIPTLISGATAQATMTLIAASGGTHSFLVEVDPGNSIVETNELNNIKSYSYFVTPIGPDLAAGLAFSPDPAYAGNPVSLQASITNLGGKNATNVVVRWYLNSLDTAPIGETTIPLVAASNITSISFVPPSVGTYNIFVWVDPDNLIPEPAPYSETNNIKNATLNVVASPNVLVLSADLNATDIMPREGQTITPRALVRNTGDASTPSGFTVDFYVDDTLVGSYNVAGTLAPGQTVLATSSGNWVAPSGGCGYHTLKAVVDATGVIVEGAIFEQDNTVTRTFQVYPTARTVYNLAIPTTRYGTLTVAESIEISGDLTIIDGGIYVLQDQAACKRGYIKINSGSLTLINSKVESNWPLSLYVRDGASLIVMDSELNLDSSRGSGLLYSDSTSIIYASNSTVDADVVAKGASLTFDSVSFTGSSLFINTAERSELWDVTFVGTTSLGLRSDDWDVGTVDFDIRNVTFNQALTSQMAFGGKQNVQLTSGSTYVASGKDWWDGMVSQSAKLSRFWWLTVDAVDGTGNLLSAAANTRINVSYLSPSDLSYARHTILPGDIYYTSSTSWPVLALEGRILYRARVADIFATAGQRWANDSYLIDGYASVGSFTYHPVSNPTPRITQDVSIDLVFSDLTPDLVVSAPFFVRDSMTSYDQPLGVTFSVRAYVNNTGKFDAYSVKVDFYSTDVDVNKDGQMDNTPDTYQAFGLLIGSVTLATIPRLGSAVAMVNWTVAESLASVKTVSVVADPPQIVGGSGTVGELSETNNINSAKVSLFAWPNLQVRDDDVLLPVTPVVGNTYTVSVTVRNIGTRQAENAVAELREGVTLLFSATFSVAITGTASVSLSWTPSTAGLHTLTVRVRNATGAEPSNTDYDLSNNEVTMPPKDVLSRPEISVSATDYTGVQLQITASSRYSFPVRVRNEGGTAALNISVEIFLNGDTSKRLGTTTGVDVGANDALNVTVNVTAPQTLGWVNFTIYADADNAYVESSESNNWANVSVLIVPPNGEILITRPDRGQQFQPGETIGVEGAVRTVPAGDPIQNLQVTVVLVDGSGQAIGVPVTNPTSTTGTFIVSLQIPSDAPQGDYNVRASASNLPSTDRQIQIVIILPWYLQPVPFIGLPVWLLIVIIAIIAGILIGVTLYLKFYGLGKLVECGECGAFIPEDSTTCPKCGVEFEKDMAKCSNCQAWIPVDVKQCPECGVEFATGEVEMADYEEKMRMQYDEVVSKFREEAQRQLGRALTDKEFQEWWRKQPTFVTFEDWLREEEEMRKMGSKACPVCGTLNSVTAIVCHKCGTPLQEQKKRPPLTPPKLAAKPVEGGPKGLEAVPGGPQPPPETKEAPKGAPAEQPVRRVVIRRSVVQPVVQKKVVKKPEEGEGEGEKSGEQSQ